MLKKNIIANSNYKKKKLLICVKTNNCVTLTAFFLNMYNACIYKCIYKTLSTVVFK